MTIDQIRQLTLEQQLALLTPEEKIYLLGYIDPFSPSARRMAARNEPRRMREFERRGCTVGRTML